MVSGTKIRPMAILIPLISKEPTIFFLASRLRLCPVVKKFIATFHKVPICFFINIISCVFPGYDFRIPGKQDINQTYNFKANRFTMHVACLSPALFNRPHNIINITGHHFFNKSCQVIFWFPA